MFPAISHTVPTPLSLCNKYDDFIVKVTTGCALSFLGLTVVRQHGERRWNDRGWRPDAMR